MTATVKAPRITAFRLELLTDPNLPLGGPGRSFKGTNALTEFRVEAPAAVAAGAGAAKPAPVKFAAASADFGDAADTPLEPNFDDKSGKSASPARSRSPSTTRRERLGHRCRTGAATHRARPSSRWRPDRPRRGNAAGLPAKQNHGGWNRDDLMNNNLGRFRLSYTAAPNPVAIRCRRPSEISPPGREAPATQSHAVFSLWRTTVAGFKDANDKIAALATQHPEPATSQMVLEAPPVPRAATRACSSAATG